MAAEKHPVFLDEILHSPSATTDAMNLWVPSGAIPLGDVVSYRRGHVPIEGSDTSVCQKTLLAVEALDWFVDYGRASDAAGMVGVAPVTMRRAKNILEPATDRVLDTVFDQMKQVRAGLALEGVNWAKELTRSTDEEVVLFAFVLAVNACLGEERKNGGPSVKHPLATEAIGRIVMTDSQPKLDQKKAAIARCLLLIHDAYEDLFSKIPAVSPRATRQSCVSSYLVDRGLARLEVGEEERKQAIDVFSLITNPTGVDGKKGPYSRYILRIAQDPMASIIKRADVHDNHDLDRLPKPAKVPLDGAKAKEINDAAYSRWARKPTYYELVPRVLAEGSRTWQGDPDAVAYNKMLSKIGTVTLAQISRGPLWGVPTEILLERILPLAVMPPRAKIAA